MEIMFKVVVLVIHLASGEITTTDRNPKTGEALTFYDCIPLANAEWAKGNKAGCYERNFFLPVIP